MSKYFGTDGFRGKAGVGLNADHAFRIGRFLGWYYRQVNGHRPQIVIGKDTRRSSYMFEYAIASGITASGADAYMLHVTTTPSVSYVTNKDDFDCGVMISASHNPYYDNGIKLVNSHGEKMEQSVLDKIELYLDGEYEALGISSAGLPYASDDEIGQIVDYSAGRNRYIAYLISLAKNSYKGMRIGLDCANGSSWMLAPSVFEALGAKTYTIGTTPNGTNINNGVGSTHIEALSSFVKENHLDAGFAFDGDADRCLAVDENGDILSGDHILYIFANELKRQGSLVNNTVVTTVLSNLGLYRALEAADIRYVQTAVGDKYVYENMLETGNCVGGEQVGHIILSKYATTGDGILVAIMLMETMKNRKTTLSKLAAPVVLFPQVMRNVAVASKEAVNANPAVNAKIEEVQKRLGKTGRVLVRPSGTEPLIRIMIEAGNVEKCEALAEEIVSVIRDEGLATSSVH